MKGNYLAVGVLLATIAGGCATHNKLCSPPVGIDKMGLYDEPDESAALAPPMEGEIARLLDRTASIKLPASVAVARLGYGYYSHGNTSLQDLSVAELEGWKKATEGLPGLIGFHPVTRLLVSADRITMDGLRKAAASLKCELLLVYTGDSGFVDNFNDAAALYWTLVGIWLVPGNVVEQETVMQAVLVDTRSGVILGTASGTAKGKRIVALGYKQIAVDKLAKEVPAKALADLQSGCTGMLKELAAQQDRQATAR